MEPALDVDAAMRAIAHPGRRRALTLVAGRERGSGELAAACGWAPPAASQHLRVLRDAGLVVVRADGTRRLYRAREQALLDLRTALDAFWRDRLERLAEAIGDAR